MAKRSRRLISPGLEALEGRIVLSLPTTAPTFGLAPPANTISLSLGNVTSPSAPSDTTATVAPVNLTPGRSATEFGVFVKPYSGSGVVPRIVGVEQGGKRLPMQFGRGYNPHLGGQPSNQAVAFFETGQAGPVTVLVQGRGLSTGQYTVETTLVGDVNGDGQVSLADEQAFAGAYVSKPGNSGYIAAADYNQNAIINQYDAMAMERNMPFYRKPGGPWVAINIAPNDALHHGSKTSGGDTALKHPVIDGYTTPGSVVLVDSTLGNYKFGSVALPTDANGYFTITPENTSGINTYDFKVLDPSGHQYIRSFPVFWEAYAKPDSPYVFKPAKKTVGGGRVTGKPAGGQGTGGIIVSGGTIPGTGTSAGGQAGGA
jgi:hypothetical protein